jgi:hypothetical protein
VDASRFCPGFNDAKERGVKASNFQDDEILSFTAAKQKNVGKIGIAFPKRFGFSPRWLPAFPRRLLTGRTYWK